VDALVVAYQVRLGSEAAAAVRVACGEALRYGRGSLVLADPLRPQTVRRAEVRPPKGEAVAWRCWALRGLLLPGQCGESPGWGLELIAHATYLATTATERVVRELRAWARSLGEVQAERLRRVDLCADFVGLPLRAEDADRLVRPPRGTTTTFVSSSKPGHPERPATRTYREASRHVTGHTVCPGNALMARLYDKTQELRVHRGGVPASEKELLEHQIWTAAGWSGEQVTRVEWQVRGSAVKELLGRSVDRLLAERSAVWRYCSERWVRLVQPTRERLRACPTDPRWRVVQSVDWGEPQAPAERVRDRSAACALQAWGALVSALAQAGQVPEELADPERVAELKRVAQRSAGHAEGALDAAVGVLLSSYREVISSALAWRFDGDDAAALDWLAVRVRTAIDREKEPDDDDVVG
jgi:hypothetical protein